MKPNEQRGERPFFVIEITRRCNLRCPHCFTMAGGSGHPGPPREALEAVLSDAAKLGVRSVAFSGGEPLLRKDLPALIRYGRDAGIPHFSLVTNGFFVDRAVAHELVTAGLDGVQVSVDGVDAADHCAIRGCEPRDFYRALRAVRAFLDGGIPVDVATLLSTRNMRRAPEMAMFCEALGARALRYCSFVPTGRAAHPDIARAHDLDPADADRFLAFLRRANGQRDARLQVAIDHGIGPWLDGGEFRCRSGEAIAYMSAEGDIYPCSGLLFEPCKVGNVFESPLGDLLDSPDMAKVRHIQKAELHGICATCSNQACSGGCRGAAYARSADLRGSVAYCNYRHSVKPASDP